MKKIITLILLSSIFCVPSIGMAKEKKEIPEYIKKKQERRAQDIKQFDANKDGVLQPGELKKSNVTKFNAADTNKDGILSREEIDSSLEQFKKEKAGMYGKGVDSKTNRLKNRYNNADKNDDKKVSKEEYESYMSKHQENFDRNGDGVISKDEYRVDDEKIPSSYMKKAKDNK
jgi:Ca2+-binding EF-hand superfamily protein